MEPKNLLIIDDEPNTVKKSITNSLPDCKTDVFTDSDAALEEINAKHYDIVFVDLHLTQDDKNLPEDRWRYEGIVVIDKIRKHHPSTTIIAYSGLFPSGNALDHRKGVKAEKAGADLVLSRADIESEVPSELKKLVVELFVKTQAIDNSRKYDFSSDFATKSACEIVGEDTIRRLINSAMPEHIINDVRALTGGLSGAVVLAIKSKTSQDTPEIANSVLKIDKSHIIDKERDSQPDIGTKFGQSSARISASLTKEFDGWKAIRMELLADLKPLRALIETIDCNDTLLGIFREISNWFSDIYLSKSRISLKRWPISELSFTATDLFRIETNLKIIESAKNVLTNQEILSANELLLLLPQIETCDFAAAAQFHFPQHGDLNCANIFVLENHSPTIIDLPEHNLYPRLFDLAQTMVDAFVMSFESLGGNRYKIDSQKNNTLIFESIILGRGESNFLANDPVITLIKKLAEVVSTEISLHGEEWQWLVAYHCLKFLRYNDIPLGRKSTLVTIALDILKPELEKS